jgi:hypothetical protein
MLVAFLHLRYHRADLVAGLLVFRLLYYIMPFAIALAILGSRELWLSLHARRTAPVVAAAPHAQENTRDTAQENGPGPDRRDERERTQAASAVDSK